MKPPKALALTRREFVEVGAAAGAGLVLRFYLPSRAASPASGTPFAPNAFLEIERNGTITISVIRSEMGQGVLTTMPMLVAEELDGSAGFGMDVRVPGMLYATVTRCPIFGGKVTQFDGTKSKAVRGVREVLQIEEGVAVVADSTWSAMRGRDALRVVWDEGALAHLSSADIARTLAELAQRSGVTGRHEGDVP